MKYKKKPTHYDLEIEYVDKLSKAKNIDEKYDIKDEFFKLNYGEYTKNMVWENIQMRIYRSKI